eukprot:364191-Chlamydomonas_euryale.AAC.7
MAVWEVSTRGALEPPVLRALYPLCRGGLCSRPKSRDAHVPVRLFAPTVGRKRAAMRPCSCSHRHCFECIREGHPCACAGVFFCFDTRARERLNTRALPGMRRCSCPGQPMHYLGCGASMHTSNHVPMRPCTHAPMCPCRHGPMHPCAMHPCKHFFFRMP